jgi:hypothetical protein
MTGNKPFFTLVKHMSQVFAVNIQVRRPALVWDFGFPERSGLVLAVLISC